MNRKGPSLACLILAAATAVTAHDVPRARAQDGEATQPPVLTPVLRPIGNDRLVGVVEFDPISYRQMRAHPHLVVEQFPLPDEFVALSLEQFRVTDASTQIVVGTPNGDVPVPHPDVTLLRGHVSEVDDSLVYLALSSAGINGFIRMRDREYLVRSQNAEAAGGAAEAFRVHERSHRDMDAHPSTFRCLSVAESDHHEELGVPSTAAGGYGWRIASVAVDCDYMFGQMFENLSEAAIYAIELIGGVSSIYERDMQVRLHIPYLRIWSTSNDPYGVDNVVTLLSNLTSHWTSNMAWVQRDIVHLLSGEPGKAGLAEVDVLCDETFGYGVSAGLDGAFKRPIPPNDSGSVEIFDIMIVAHEMGHQFGSPHTHCYSPPIDSCGMSFDDCWSGTFQCQQGTIMSYCDRLECVGQGGGKDLRFHDRVITRIRQSVDASCLKSGLNPVYIDWTNNTGLETGSNLFPFNTVLEGMQVVVPGGTLQVDAGNYPEMIVANRPSIIRTTGGTVRIGP